MLGAYNIDSDDEEEEEEVQSNVPKSASTHIQELEKVMNCPDSRFFPSILLLTHYVLYFLTVPNSHVIMIL